MNRKIDPSIVTISIFISKKESISFNVWWKELRLAPRSWKGSAAMDGRGSLVPKALEWSSSREGA